MTREQFLDKYLTVVTKKNAVKEQDDKAKAFVKKYLTQVGCPAAEPAVEEPVEPVTEEPVEPVEPTLEDPEAGGTD